MGDVKKTLRHLGLMYLLLMLEIPFVVDQVPDIFPFFNFSSVYLIFLSLLLICYYSRIVVPRSGLRACMLGIAGMIFLLLLFRGLKYSVFSEVDFLKRQTWYLYYLPMLLIPTFLSYISIHCFEKGEIRFTRRWLVILVLSVLTVLMILTNDLHQQAFRFRPGFENWDSDYSYGWVYTVAIAIIYGLGFVSILSIIVKSRIFGVQRRCWLILIPFVSGVAVLILLVSGRMPTINNIYPIQVPEAYCVMIVGVLECCIQLGLIPSNQKHRSIFNLSSINAQIIKEDGTPVYLSEGAVPLCPEDAALEDGTRWKEHSIFRKIPLTGGYGIWIEDVSELDRLNLELQNTESRLAEEMALVRLQNELKEKEAKAAQRSALYDIIARKTVNQSQAISQLAKTLQNSDDESEVEAGRSKITLLATYIKRYANLLLLSEEKTEIPIGELTLSVSDVLRRLGRCGIPAEIMNVASGTCTAETILAAFEGFEMLLEAYYDDLRGVYVVLSDTEEGVKMKMTLEAVRTMPASKVFEEMTFPGLWIETEQEEDVFYYCFHLKRGDVQ